MTKAEEAFVDQMTRKMLVEWCESQVISGLPRFPVMPESNPFVQYAMKKGWVASSLLKVLSGGFTTAAAFLRR
jgi:hypothetical protein